MYLSPLFSMHAPFSHWTLLTKHKFKGKIIKHFKTMTAERKAKCPVQLHRLHTCKTSLVKNGSLGSRG